VRQGAPERVIDMCTTLLLDDPDSKAPDVADDSPFAIASRRTTRQVELARVRQKLFVQQEKYGDRESGERVLAVTCGAVRMHLMCRCRHVTRPAPRHVRRSPSWC
jgi:hypothetical protein